MTFPSARDSLEMPDGDTITWAPAIATRDVSDTVPMIRPLCAKANDGSAAHSAIARMRLLNDRNMLSLLMRTTGGRKERKKELRPTKSFRGTALDQLHG
jgi:hypothetical protein